MSDGAVGMLVLIGLSAVCAGFCHALIKRYLLAAIVAALVASLLFLVAATIQLGYMDPFAPIAFVTGGFVAFVIALVIGVPFVMLRHHAR